MVEGEITVELMVFHPFEKERRMDGVPGRDLNDSVEGAKRVVGINLAS
jgi:hypothetical protein